MGCFSSCCKKKKRKPVRINTLNVQRRDTKFFAESIKHLKIQIQNNNNSNSNEVPLINNFLKATLNNRNSVASKINEKKSNSSKSSSSEKKKANSDKKVQNIVDENLYKQNNSEKNSDNESSEISQSDQSNKTIKQKSSSENYSKISKEKNLKNNNSESVISKSDNSISSKEKQEVNGKNENNIEKEKSDLSLKVETENKNENEKENNNISLKEESNSNLIHSNEQINKSQKVENSMNMNEYILNTHDKIEEEKEEMEEDKEKEEEKIEEKIEENNEDNNNNENDENQEEIKGKKKTQNKKVEFKETNDIIKEENDNEENKDDICTNKSDKMESDLNKTEKLHYHNTSIDLLNDSVAKIKLKRIMSRKIPEHSDTVFVDYKTFIKGKPYSELNKEYKHGISIGEGGFGKVTTIIHKKTGQLRAMKLIKKSAEFGFDEVENLMLLNHPNIMKLYEYFFEKDNIYIIMEYIRGDELFNKINEVHVFSEEVSAIIIKSILQGIAYCHSLGIIHRDIKPENILVPTGGVNVDYTLLKIIDFGASVLKKGGKKITFRFGTPYYIAPEVLKQSYDEKCDVWSIGVILYLLLIGSPPFDGENDSEIWKKIINEEINYSDPKFKNLSPESKDLLQKLLIKNPEKRLSASEALEHIWIKKYAPHTKVSRVFSRKIYNNLKKFEEKSQFSTAVVTFITNYMMSDDELKSLKKLFFELDEKGKGVITKEDLFRGMDECFDHKITKEEVDKIFSKIDYDNNGTISFDEFLKAAIDKKKLLTDEKLKAAFALFDMNGDGDIEAKELQEIMGENNDNQGDVWAKMIEEVDLDGNGVIDFEEFKDMMKKLCS